MSVAISDQVLRQVGASFPPEVLARALICAQEGGVNLVRDEWPVVAQIRGGYVVTVHYTSVNRHMRGECSCSEASHCVHAAAAAMVALGAGREREAARDQARKQRAVGEWLTHFAVGRDETPARSETRNLIAYVLAPADGAVTLAVHKTTALRRGGFGRSVPMTSLADPARGAPAWVPVEDLRRIALLRAVTRAAPQEVAMRTERVDGPLLAELAASGQLFWRTVERPLRPGSARTATLRWRHDEGEHRVGIDETLVVVPAQDVHYLDPEAGTLGPLDVGLPAAIVQRLLLAPPVPTVMLPAVQRSLRPLLGEHALLGDEIGGAHEVAGEAPVPHLYVCMERDADGAGYVDVRADAMYGQERYPLGEWLPRRPAPRDLLAEGRLRQRLEALLEQSAHDNLHGNPREVLAHARFVAHHVVPALVEDGWICEVAEDFPVEPAKVPTGWVEKLRPLGPKRAWFGLELGVIIAGRTVPLLPILLDAIKDGEIPLDDALLTAKDIPGINLTLPDGEVVYVSGERLQRWLRPLFEVYLRPGALDDGALAIPAFTAAALAEELGRFADAGALGEARQRLTTLLGLEPRAERETFGATLRTYQRQGLAWLLCLHQLGYGGLLADDMGLGKTVQILAFLDQLHAAGELDQAPALVVAPRSVVGHWRDEAARFAPQLAPVVHLGAGRARRGDELTGPVVVTSYQTMLRDRELLAGRAWTTVIFDEAQNLKNPGTRLRKAAATLRATSRFAVTGTPIENHLRELWSQLDLAMPGILGRRATFETVLRRPIEKHGSESALTLLRQRIRPLLLRRVKREVELDLPAKTEIVERVDLPAAQRDLYESLRLSLDADVRKALRDRGVHGAHMVVLEALLKLRQCCCDPRLVGTPEAERVARSAKLERLLAMLEELVDEGRSVLVFSQFTSMLALIADGCDQAGIAHLRLTGRTRDRDQVVRSFQAGEAPVLLVSLKAGGTGLNLTRADTVIHYDPWWNPAAEDQATDRAHRIGQTRGVFVYRLVARGTLEERIIELQRDKRALTDAALAGGGATALEPDDLRSLYYQLV